MSEIIPYRVFPQKFLRRQFFCRRKPWVRQHLRRHCRIPSLIPIFVIHKILLNGKYVNFQVYVELFKKYQIVFHVYIYCSSTNVHLSSLGYVTQELYQWISCVTFFLAAKFCMQEEVEYYVRPDVWSLNALYSSLSLSRTLWGNGK